MGVNEAIDRLRTISDEAQALHSAFEPLARLGKGLDDSQLAAVKKLADDLELATRDAARTWRREEIGRLDGIIDAHETSLSVQGLPGFVRDEIEGDLLEKRARRARLLAADGTDFGDVLGPDGAQKLAELARRARTEVRRKERASAFLAVMVRLADVSLDVARRLVS